MIAIICFVKQYHYGISGRPSVTFWGTQILDLVSSILYIGTPGIRLCFFMVWNTLPTVLHYLITTIFKVEGIVPLSFVNRTLWMLFKNNKKQRVYIYYPFIAHSQLPGTLNESEHMDCLQILVSGCRYSEPMHTNI